MILTHEQKVAKIMELEIEASKIEQQAKQAGVSIYNFNQFPKLLKLNRKIQKLRNSL